MSASILLALSLVASVAQAQPPDGAPSLQVGDRIWMTENLKVDRFRNGDPIPKAATAQEWAAAGESQQPAWCDFEGDPSKGRLYNAWAVRDPRGLAPEGWRVATDEDWSKLLAAAGGEGAAGAQLRKPVGSSPVSLGLPLAGYRLHDGGFSALDYYGNYWSGTWAYGTLFWSRRFFSRDGKVERSSSPGAAGFAVRCVADAPKSSEPSKTAQASAAPGTGLADSPQGPGGELTDAERQAFALATADFAAEPPRAEPVRQLNPEEEKQAEAERDAFAQAAADFAAEASRASPGKKARLEAKRDEAILRWADATFDKAGRCEARGAPSDAARYAERVLDQMQAFPALEARRDRALDLFLRNTEHRFRFAQESAARGHWASAVVTFWYQRVGAPLPPDHPRNLWFAETQAKGAAYYRALEAEATAHGLPGAALLHRRLATLVETGESKAGRGPLQAALEPRWTFEVSSSTCRGFEGEPLAAAPGTGTATPVRLEAACSFSSKDEVRMDDPYQVKVEYQQPWETCQDNYAATTRQYGSHSQTSYINKGRTCERGVETKVRTETHYRDRLHRFTHLRLTGTMTVVEGGQTLSLPVSLYLDDDDTGEPSLGLKFVGGAEKRLYRQALNTLAERLAKQAPEYRKLRGRRQLARGEEAAAAGRALEAQDAWMLAAVDGESSATLDKWIDESLGLGVRIGSTAARIKSDEDLFPIVPDRLPSEIPGASAKSSGIVVRRPLLPPFSRDPRLDHMAWVFAAFGSATPESAQLRSAKSLSVGLESLGMDRGSIFSPAWNWGGELGVDQRMSFPFDFHAGLGAAVSLWRLTVAPMAMIGVDRMVIDDADEGLVVVPAAFDYGGGGHLYLELAHGVALDGHAAYLWRAGDNPAELRTGLRLVATTQKRALFLGVRYHDYGQATAWSAFVGYGGD